MKLCKDCMHYKEINLCLSPNNGLSFIDGKPIPLFATSNRSHDRTGCGKEGVFWESKEILDILKEDNEAELIKTQTKHWWKFW